MTFAIKSWTGRRIIGAGVGVKRAQDALSSENGKRQIAAFKAVRRHLLDMSAHQEPNHQSVESQSKESE